MQCKLVIKQKFTIIHTCIIQTEAITTESVRDLSVYLGPNGPKGAFYKTVRCISLGLTCGLA